MKSTKHAHYHLEGNKMLSYHREIELQGALVLAKSGRLELGDNILRTLWVYLQPLWLYRPAKLSNSGKQRKIKTITLFKAIQGHQSKAHMQRQ